MANYREITGDYEIDFENIREMFRELMNNTNIDNLEGEKIEHQFTTILDEEIKHKLQRVPTRVVPLLFEDAQATFQFVSATAETVTLKASDAALKLNFYLE